MAYGLKTKGGNKTLNPHSNDEWMKGKKIGRPKQIWVPETEQPNLTKRRGHWEKDRS